MYVHGSLYGAHMPMWGIILKPWPDEPVFHGFGEMVRGTHGWEDVAKCGRYVSSATPWLPMKHVVKFARPCKGCFPDGIVT